MARIIKGEGFNKEKLVFLLSSFCLAGGLYVFLADRPLELTVEDPLSNSEEPKDNKESDMTVPFDVAFYVKSGTYENRLTGKQDDANRERKNPFSPKSDFKIKNLEDDDLPPIVVRPEKKPVIDSAPPPEPPPQDDGGDSDDEPQQAMADSNELAVSFMGVIRNPETRERFAMLRMKDGTPPVEVRVGDVVPELEYKITRISPQSIWLTDAGGRPYILKDQELEEDDDDGFDDEDDDGFFKDEPEPKPKKKTKPKVNKSNKKQRQKRTSKNEGSDRKSEKVERQIERLLKQAERFRTQMENR